MTIVAPEGEQAKVLDFGVSKLLDADSEQKATATGCAIGSPLYMSPEQFTGGAVTERSDIYSFGCMLYELLAGQPPFERETVFALLQAHLHETPAPLSFPPEWRLMGEKLEMVAGKAMQKDPPDRFATMGEIRQALQEISNDPSVALGFGVSAGGVKNPRNRHASPRVMAVGAAAVGCVALALAAGISIWQNRVPDESDANNSGTQSTIAYNLYHRGQLDEAESEARAALKNAKTEFEHRSALMILARSLEDSPHHERRAQAIPMFEELLSYARKANKRTREDIEVMQRCYISTAELALESNAPQAEELARRAYYDARDLYGPEDWRRPRLMAEWARRRGDLQSTLRFDKEMLEALDRHSPPEDETPELAALAARDFLRSGAKPRRIKADILKLLPGPQQFDPNGPKLNKALNEALGLDKP
jgi:tetratricopeptide (TPR) repeat protein